MRPWRPRVPVNRAGLCGGGQRCAHWPGAVPKRRAKSRGLIVTSVEKVESGTALVTSAGATMDEIVQSVRRVADVIGKLRLRPTNKAQALLMSTSPSATLDQMTQQNAALVEQSAAAAENLREQTARMKMRCRCFGWMRRRDLRRWPCAKARRLRWRCGSADWCKAHRVAPFSLSLVQGMVSGPRIVRHLQRNGGQGGCHTKLAVICRDLVFVHHGQASDGFAQGFGKSQCLVLARFAQNDDKLLTAVARQQVPARCTRGCECLPGRVSRRHR